MADEIELEQELNEIEAVEQEIEQREPEQAKPELPEKYRGKSVDDIVRMHQEAEKLISRQAQEVGEVRRLADELLKSKLTPKAEEKPQEVDIFENPQEAIRQAVSNHPDVLQAKQLAIQAQQEQARQILASKHPDFGQVVQDGEFVEWVKSSRKRIQLFQEAEAYDVDAADELLSTFKQLKAIKQAQVSQAENETEKAAREKALKSASVDTSGTGEKGKKVYRRADLIRLKLQNPSKYEAMADEINRAYIEGRVR